MMTSQLISSELNRRRDLWKKIQEVGSTNVSPSLLRDIGAYGGAAGVWRDKPATQHLPNAADGVAVSILHTGRHYTDDLSDDGIIYHYPNTRRPGGTDEAEINAVKNASDLDLPVFVISPGKDKETTRTVRIAWVKDWDDQSQTFLLLFGEESEPYETPPEPDAPFTLKTKPKPKYTKAKIRTNQTKFRYQVLAQYGVKCAVCNITEQRLIHAAHICDKEFGGSDDWRNGIPLCANHHIAFDEGLFTVHPDKGALCSDNSLTLSDLGISENKLSPKAGFPHRVALAWKFDKLRRKKE
jgi:putative restriction endonuclease